MRQLVVFLALGGVFGVLAGPLLGAPGCASPGQGPAGTGDLAVDVTLPSMAPALDHLSYRVSRSGALVAMQDVPQRGAAQPAPVLFVGLGAHAGYDVEVNGSSADGVDTCMGSAEASVMARAVTAVSIALTCTVRSGTAHITTTFDCPLIMAVTAAPRVTSVGAKVALSSEVSASDAGATTYQWTASSGTVAEPTAASTTFTCAEAGVTSIQLNTMRGACADKVVMVVNCVGKSP